MDHYSEFYSELKPKKKAIADWKILSMKQNFEPEWILFWFVWIYAPNHQKLIKRYNNNNNKSNNNNNNNNTNNNNNNNGLQRWGRERWEESRLQFYGFFPMVTATFISSWPCGPFRLLFISFLVTILWFVCFSLHFSDRFSLQTLIRTLLKLNKKLICIFE